MNSGCAAASSLDTARTSQRAGRSLEAERLTQSREHLAVVERLPGGLDGRLDLLDAARKVGERAVLFGGHPHREQHVRDALEGGVVRVEHDQRVELGQQLDAAEVGRVEHVVAHHDHPIDAAAAQAVEHGAGVAEAERTRARRVRSLVGLHQQCIGGALYHRDPGGFGAERVEQTTEREEFFVGRVRRGEPRDHTPPLVSTSFLSRAAADSMAAVKLVTSGTPSEARTSGSFKPIGCADLVIRHPAGVADPGLVHGVVATRQVAVDLVVRDSEVDVAAVAAPGADARHVVQEPDADLESEVLGGERADGADVGHVHRVVVRERHARVGLDHRVIAAIQDGELAGARDLAREAHAAAAQDAALLIKDDGRPEIHVLLERAARLARARLAHAVLVGVVLELALARLIADRTIERMVDEQQLHHAFARAAHGIALRAHDHAFGHGRVAGDLELGHALDLDLTQAAGAVDRELRVPAVVRDLDAVHQQADVVERLQERPAGGDLDLDVVDGDARHLQLEALGERTLALARRAPRNPRGSGAAGPAPARRRRRRRRRWSGPPSWRRCRAGCRCRRRCPAPRSMRSMILCIQPVPSRHCVHWPQDSSRKKYEITQATLTMQVVSSITMIPPVPSMVLRSRRNSFAIGTSSWPRAGSASTCRRGSRP